MQRVTEIQIKNLSQALVKSSSFIYFEENYKNSHHLYENLKNFRSLTEIICSKKILFR